MSGRILNGRYELTEKIGEGGMALAWKGRDLLLGRTVTVKLMRDSLAADSEFITRFRREAQAAANLSQEHIAAVYDFGKDQDTHYIVMEYVHGEDLRRRLKRQSALSPLEAVELGIQVAEALEAAHAKGIVHRDIKPANILITAEGQVKVTDFGIARAVSASEETSTDTLLGSVHYISPEQARGEAVGPQADIYSLGTVLFEALTGRPPFQASNPVAVIHKHIYDPPPSLHSLRENLPMELEAILLRCLSKDLSGRYATTRELLNYLRGLRSRLLSKQGRTTAAESPIILAPAPKRKASRWVRVTGVLALVLAAGAAVFWWSLLQSGDVSEVIAPKLTGMDIDSAQAVVEVVGLKLRKTGDVYSSSIPAGRIVSQSPLADEKLNAGGVIEIQVSLGKETVRVPEVTEMTEGQARRLLENAGLTVGAVEEEESETLPRGMVIASKPPAGTDMPRGSAVGLVVSNKEEIVVTPPPDAAPPPDTARPPRAETISFRVPRLGQRNKVVVLVEASDESGRRILFRGTLGPGQSTPSLKIPSERPVTVRIKMDGRVVEEKTFEE